MAVVVNREFGARKAIELPAGAAKLSGIEVGDRLEFEPLRDTLAE
jgi:uncharacterized membrane protein (UPF0127 family)